MAQACFGIRVRGAKPREILRFLASEISIIYKKLLIYSFLKFHFFD